MSDDARELYRTEPREESEAERLLRHAPRWCALCNQFGTHHTDGHQSDDDEIADSHEWAAIARATLRESRPSPTEKGNEDL